MFRGFKATKCKTAAKLCVSRIKLLRIKRNVELPHMEREIADLLKKGKDECAWTRVGDLCQEKNLLAGYEILEIYLELIEVRAHLLEKAKETPIDMVEALTSLMYAAPRVADLPELLDVYNIVSNKFGQELGLETPTEEPTAWQVNDYLRRYLSVAPPEVDHKLNLLSNIVKQNGVDIDLEDFPRGIVIQQKNPPGPPEGASRRKQPNTAEIALQQQLELIHQNVTEEEDKFVSEPDVPGHSLEQPAMEVMDTATKIVGQTAATDTPSPTDEGTHAQYSSENAPGQTRDTHRANQEDVDTPEPLDEADYFSKRVAMLKKAQWTDAPRQVRDAAGGNHENTNTTELLAETDDFSKRLAMLKKAQWIDEK